MIETFTSRNSSPLARGEEFGSKFSAQIAANIDRYHRLFLLRGQRCLAEIHSFADQVLSVVRSHSASIADEIQGMAYGAKVPVSHLMALNARTELLAVCGPMIQPECSVVIALNANQERPAPVAIQSWDWLSEFGDGWLLWTIEGDDGHVVRTLTEYGIVGKIGVNSAGVGVLLNFLAHERDGQLPIGLPVHVAVRSILDERISLNNAVARVTSAPLTSSSAISVVAKSGNDVSAFSLELFPGGPAFCLPSDSGVLIHTNHFLSAAGGMGDRVPKMGSSSFSRYEQLCRKLRRKDNLGAGEILQAMSSHVGGSHAVCSHPLPGAKFGEKSETLAVVQLHIGAGKLSARKGGPCSPASWTELGTA